MVTIVKCVCLMCPELSSSIPISLMRKQRPRGVQCLTVAAWPVLFRAPFAA